MLRIDDFNYYCGDLEILTSLGFKTIADLKQTDLIAQWSNTKECICFIQPYYLRTWKGQLDVKRFCRKTQSEEFVMNLPIDNFVPIVLESNVWGSSISTVPVKSLSNNLARSLVRKFRLTSTAQQGGLSLHDRFNIAIQADGTIYTPQRLQHTNFNRRATFSFAKVDKMDRLESMLIDMNLMYEVRDGTVNSNGTVNSVSYSIQTPFTVYKRFADWVNLCDKNFMWCRMFIDELSHWDSHISEYGISYSNKNWSDLSIVQAIAVLCGFDTSISLNSTSGVYSLSVNMTGSSRKIGMTLTDDKINTVWYSVGMSHDCNYFVARANRTVLLLAGN